MPCICYCMCHDDNVVKCCCGWDWGLRHGLDSVLWKLFIALFGIFGKFFNVALRVSVCFQFIFMNYKLRLSRLAIATFILFYGIIRIINIKWSKMLMTMGIVVNVESYIVCFVCFWYSMWSLKSNMENVRLIVTRNIKIMNPDLVNTV